MMTSSNAPGVSRTEPTGEAPLSALGRQRRRFSLATVTATLLAGLPLAPAGAAATEAEQFIADVGDQVVGILRQDDVGDDEKLSQLKTLLDSHTDLELVAKLVLGQHWRTASAEQREQYVQLFKSILMNTMAERLGDYGGETFEIVGSNELNERDSMVETRIVRPSGGQPLNVDWRVRQGEGEEGFAIIDVIAEGVSLVVSQRNEVGSIVNRRGMDGLIETMRERSAEGETAL